MCLGSSSPPPPPPLPPPAPLPRPVDEAVRRGREDERRRAALASGIGASNKTGGQGLLASAQTAKKTLLGGQ